MSQIKSYKDLIVWQKSVILVKKVYFLTKTFPKEEIFGLTSQMRRAAVSIPSNIAEGYGRRTRKDYGQFCSIAYGSSLELETQLVIARELNYCTARDLLEIELLVAEVGKMLNSLVHKLNPIT